MVTSGYQNLWYLNLTEKSTQTGSTFFWQIACRRENRMELIYYKLFKQDNHDTYWETPIFQCIASKETSYIVGVIQYLKVINKEA